jgi:membrane-associated phospholipid phosphatase
MRQFANIISFVLQPLLMPTFGILFLFQVDLFAYQPAAYKLYVIIGTFVLTALVPIFAILILRKLGLVTTLFINNRRERTIPYLITLIAYVIYVFFLWKAYMPNWVVAMMIGCASTIVLITIINIKWKISAHLSGIGGLTASIFVVAYQLGLNPYGTFATMIILSGLVASSRVILRAHTPLQTLGGFLVGILCVGLPGILVV